MIVALKSCPDEDGIVLAIVPPDLSRTMGGFASARWDQERRAYLIEAKDVAAFGRFLKHTGNRMIDDRKAARTTPGTWTPEPLPECTACGQPASRTVSARLELCPACGEKWVPRTFRLTAEGQRAVPPNAAFRAALAALKGKKLFTMPEDEGSEVPPF